MKSSKGFSLVELIIVIAIMAILVGVMAPMLYKYINKTKVSADIQLCDTVKEALMIAMADPDVLMDNNSAPYLKKLNDGDYLAMGTVGNGNELGACIKDITGFDCCSISGYRNEFETKVARNQGFLGAQYFEGQLYVWIDYSDNTGKDDTPYRASRANQVDGSFVIAAK